VIENILPSTPSTTPSSLLASGSSQFQTITSQNTGPTAVVTVTAAQSSSPAITEHTSTSSGGLSRTAKIALGAAIPVGVIGIIALVLFVLARRRRRNRRWVQDNDQVAGGALDNSLPQAAAAAGAAEKKPFIPPDRKVRSSIKKKPVPGSIRKHGYRAAERSELLGTGRDDITIRSDPPPPYL
jgi:hypothetical protein